MAPLPLSDRARRGESSRLQTQAPLHHQPLRGDARWDARLLEGRFAIATATRSTSRLGRETLPQRWFTTNH
ncbi:MAG: hypothetical protein ACHBN1_13060 [Heteroscytonema crispum UTEX LB 1556]